VPLVIFRYYVAIFIPTGDAAAFERQAAAVLVAQKGRPNYGLHCASTAYKLMTQHTKSLGLFHVVKRRDRDRGRYRR
jgi:hypothetical protein